MEYLNVITGLEDARSATLHNLSSQHPELWAKIPTQLREFITDLHQAGTPKWVTAYDELVTCHSVFTPFYTQTESGSIQDSNLKLDPRGDWNHLITINQTGETTSFTTSNVSLKKHDAETHIKEIMAHASYRAAHLGFGFSRITTPNKAVLSGRNQQSLDFRGGSVNELMSLSYNERNHTPQHDLFSGFSTSKVRTQGPTYSQDEVDRASIVCQRMLNGEMFSLRSNILFLHHVGVVLAAYGFPIESIHQVLEPAAQDRKTLIEQIKLENEQLRQSVALAPGALSPAWFNEEANPLYEQLMFPESVLHFVLAGHSSEIRQNRLSFIHQSYALLFGETLKEQILNSKGPELINRSLKTIIANDNQQNWRMAKFIQSIDTGVYPYELLPERFNLPGTYSKKEIQHGLSLFRMINIKDSHYALGMGDCIALTKVPDAWLRTANGVHLLEVNPRSDLDCLQEKADRLKLAKDRGEYETISYNFASNLIQISQTLLKYLKKTGVKLAVAQQAGDKETIKSITKDWIWLSKHPKGVISAILSLDDKHQIAASLKDFPRILHQFSESIIFRAVSDFSPAHNTDSLSLNGYNALAVDYDELDTCLCKHYEENNSQDDDYWDEDEEVFVESEPVSFWDSHNKTHHFNEDDLANYLAQNNYDLRGVLEKNSALHKEYNKVIQQMNEHSKHQISWTPFLESPQIINEQYLFQNISDRLSLLEEGTVMGHCVFSYLGACTTGQSIILSVRDADNPDERIATVEIAPPNEDEEDAFTIKQCYGPYNNEVARSVSDAAHQLASDLNAGKITYSLAKDDAEEHIDFIRDIQNNPYEEGAKACAIPYDTDAAYEAYIFMEKYLPDNSYTQLMNADNQGLGYLAEQSDFFTRGVFPMKELAVKYDLPYEVLIAVKAAIKTDWFDSKAFDVILPHVRAHLEQCMLDIQNAIKKLPKPDGKTTSGDTLKQAQLDYQSAVLQTQSLTLHQSISIIAAAPSVDDISHLLVTKKSVSQIFARSVAPALAETMNRELNKVDYRIRMR